MKFSMIIAAVFMLQILALPVSADIIRETTTRTTTTTISDNAPLYTGPVVGTELEELTQDDFKQLGGTKPIATPELYRQYRSEMDDPDNTRPRLYKMKVNRELLLADFEGVGIAPELARVRYNSYVTTYRAKPEETHYVYVYYTPVVSAILR